MSVTCEQPEVTIEPPTADPDGSIDAALKGGLDELAGRYRSGDKLLFGDLFAVFSKLGTRSGAFVVLVVAAPFISPTSLGPLTIPASLLTLIMGIQLIRRHGDPTGVPQATPGARVGLRKAIAVRLAAWREWILTTRMPRRLFGFMRFYLLMMLRVKKFVLRVRTAILGAPVVHRSEAAERRAQWRCGVGMVVGAMLLGTPVPLVPFSNTFPALGIVLVTLGWLERDGLMTILAWISYALGLALYIVLAVAIVLVGFEVVVEWIPRLL